MRKKFIILLTFAGLSTLQSQTIEEKIAVKTCECLQKSSNITNDVFRDCLTKSMTEQIFADKDIGLVLYN